MTTYNDAYPSSASGWTNSSNVGADDSSVASTTVPAGGTSATLITTTYGLAVDSDEVLADLELEKEVVSISDGLRMEYALTLDGTNPATPFSEQPTGLWGLLEITAAQANSANFGVLARARDFGSAGGTVTIDYLRIAVRGVEDGNEFGRYFQAREPGDFPDAEAGGICQTSGLYYPGSHLTENEEQGHVGTDFRRRIPDDDQWIEYDGRKL